MHDYMLNVKKTNFCNSLFSNKSLFIHVKRYSPTHFIQVDKSTFWITFQKLNHYLLSCCIEKKQSIYKTEKSLELCWSWFKKPSF